MKFGTKEATTTVVASRAEWEAMRKPCQHSRTVANVKDERAGAVPGAMVSVTLPCTECGD